MKTIKLFTALLACVASMAFISCNSFDDEANQITPAQVEAAFQQIKGDYAGVLIYLNPNAATAADQNDSINVNWQINTDSTLVIKNFPSTPVSLYINDTDMAKAIAAEPTQELKAYYGFYNVTNIGFLINPLGATYNVTYGGATHKVQVLFYTNNQYSFGLYEPTKKLMQLQLFAAGIYVDGQLNQGLLTKAVPMVFSGTKN